MRREALIIAGVLVPCAALVWLEATWSDDAEATPPLAVNSSPLARSPRAFDAAVERSADTLDAGAEPPDALPVAIRAAVRAVEPEVRRCFEDQRAHLHGQQRLAVEFTPTSAGRFENVVVAPTPNPYVSACIEDVFAEVPWHPTGAETFERATHVFTFGTR